MRGSKLRRDVERTKAEYFQDWRSHWTFATHKGPAKCFLYGLDMGNQRLHVYARDEGKCQKCGKHITSFWGFEMHHIKHRGRGGDDSVENLQTLCIDCHRGKRGIHA